MKAITTEQELRAAALLKLSVTGIGGPKPKPAAWVLNMSYSVVATALRMGWIKIYQPKSK